MRSRRRLFLGLMLVALLAGCGAGKGGGTTIVITTGSAKSVGASVVRYRVPSGSMEPTYPLGEHIEVEAAEPKLGDVVVFHPPEGATELRCGSSQPSPGGAPCDKPVSTEETDVKFLKRIVAGPGDTIKIIEGHVIRDGEREADSYIRPCPGVAECNFPVQVTVPSGEWYLLGDNRGESDDSRFWGPVPTAWILGVVKGSDNN
jgi:signal peptidase I